MSHVAWNVGGLAFPLLVAVVTIPPLLSNLGQERFGLLALAWGLIGYAGALDLGIGRALTQMVSRMRGEGSHSSIPDVLVTASRITLLAGITGGLLIWLATVSGGYSWIITDSTPSTEIRNAMLLLGVALPAQAMSATYRGLNEAFMNFKGINFVRAGLGTLNFAGPYAVSLFTVNLPWLVGTLVISRLCALLIFRWLAKRCIRDDAKYPGEPKYSEKVAVALFSFGGWVTVSSVVSPILVQSDRFFIAAYISATAVTAYTLPYEIIVQCLFLVGAVSSVMFPVLGKMIHEDPDNWRRYFRTMLLNVTGIMFLVSSVLFFTLPIILPWWIQGNLNATSIVVGQILCLGVFATSISAMYYAVLHAVGRADLTAKVHLIELPIYLVALHLLLTQFGIVGAAWAWVGRMVFDAFALFLLVRRR